MKPNVGTEHERHIVVRRSYSFPDQRALASRRNFVSTNSV
jgi:hypothetical protein